jgi:hypothetical protein
MNCLVLLRLGVRKRWQKMHATTTFVPLTRRHCNGVRSLRCKWFTLRSQWDEAMNRVLRAFSVSEKGIKRLSESDKACCVMEWNDQRESSYHEIRKILFEEADV